MKQVPLMFVVMPRKAKQIMAVFRTVLYQLPTVPDVEIGALVNISSSHGLGFGLSLVGCVRVVVLLVELGMACLKKGFYLFLKSPKMLIRLPLFSHRQS